MVTCCDVALYLFLCECLAFIKTTHFVFSVFCVLCVCVCVCVCACARARARVPIPVSTWSKVWFCGRLFLGLWVRIPPGA